MDGCLFTKQNLCMSRTSKAAHGGTEAGWEGIKKDCSDHERSEKFRRESKMKDIDKKKAAKAATAPATAGGAPVAPAGSPAAPAGGAPAPAGSPPAAAGL